MGFKKTLKRAVKPLAPHGFVKWYETRGAGAIRWVGDYSTWKEAAESSGGYDSGEVIQKVKESALQVASGKRVYERDSVLFDEIEYSWPALAGLMYAAVRLKGKLNVLDFGGALGSSFFQNRKFLNQISEVSWCVVEQEAFVKIGKTEMDVKGLRFFSTIHECRASVDINVAYISSVLQYLPNPKEVILEILESRPEMIILDRLSVIDSERDRIVVQSVPEPIYKASYPCWLFCENQFMQPFRDYEVVERFVSSLENMKHLSDGHRSMDIGYILQRKK